MVEIKFLRQVLTASFIAALLYCVTVYVYIVHMSFQETYILYIGNFLFATVIAIFIAWFYKQHQSDIGTIRLVVIGGKAAFAGIVMACIITLILLLILVPSIFKPVTESHLHLQGSPGQFQGKNEGFGSILFLNVVIGNAGAAFFISLLIPFAVMKNIYEGEKGKRTLSTKNENPKKNYHL